MLNALTRGYNEQISITVTLQNKTKSSSTSSGVTVENSGDLEKALALSPVDGCDDGRKHLSKKFFKVVLARFLKKA